MDALAILLGALLAAIIAAVVVWIFFLIINILVYPITYFLTKEKPTLKMFYYPLETINTIYWHSKYYEGDIHE